MNSPTLHIKSEKSLTKQEIRQMVDLFIVSFFPDEIINTEKYTHIIRTLATYNIFEWYILKNKDGLIIGMGSFIKNFENSYVTDINPTIGENLCNIAIHPDYRGQGLGKFLLNKTIDGICKQTDDPIILSIHKENRMYATLIKFYTSCGFVYHTENDKMVYFIFNHSKLPNGI